MPIKLLPPAAIMIFPDPAGAVVRDEIASSLAGGARWSEVELDRKASHVVRASSACALRDRGAWKLAFHQQTPL